MTICSWPLIYRHPEKAARIERLLYDDLGEIIDPSSGQVVGNFGASGVPLADSSPNQVFLLGQTSAQTNTQDFTLRLFDQKSFELVSSLTIPNVIGYPNALIWKSCKLC